jgi:hypothetical protein
VVGNTITPILKQSDMRVKLLKDLEIGRRNEIIDVTAERARYLLKVGAALEWKQTAEVDDVELTEAEAIKPRVVKKKKTAKKTAKK